MKRVELVCCQNILCKALRIFLKEKISYKPHITLKVLTYHLDIPRVPLMVGIP